MSNLSQYSPEQLLLMNLAVGGAGFGAMRLLQDSVGGKQTASTDNNHLTIDIPTQRPEDKKKPAEPESVRQRLLAALHSANNAKLPNEQQSSGHAMHPADLSFSSPKTANEKVANPVTEGAQAPGYDHSLMTILGAGLGLPAGFMGTKMLYDKMKGSQLDGDIDKKKKEYQEALIRAKFAEESPLTDQFCEAIAAELNKTAMDSSTIDYGMNQNTSDMFRRSDVGGAGQTISDVWKLLGATTGGATLMTLINMHNKKKNTESKSQYPSRLELNKDM